MNRSGNLFESCLNFHRLYVTCCCYFSSKKQSRISQNEWLILFRLRSSLRFNKIINFKTSFLKDSSKFLKFIWIIFLSKKREKFHLQPNKIYSSRFRQIRYKQIFDPESSLFPKLQIFIFISQTLIHTHPSHNSIYFTSLPSTNLLSKFPIHSSNFHLKKGRGTNFTRNRLIPVQNARNTINTMETYFKIFPKYPGSAFPRCQPDLRQGPPYRFNFLPALFPR